MHIVLLELVPVLYDYDEGSDTETIVVLCTYECTFMFHGALKAISLYSFYVTI